MKAFIVFLTLLAIGASALLAHEILHLARIATCFSLACSSASLIINAATFNFLSK